MRTHKKFVQTALKFTLKDIKSVEVKFDPFHQNSQNIREFYHGITSKKRVKAYPYCLLRHKIVSDNSNPVVKVKFQDDHVLNIDCQHLESGHIVDIIADYQRKHAKLEDN